MGSSPTKPTSSKYVSGKLDSLLPHPILFVRNRASEFFLVVTTELAKQIENML